MTWFRKLLLWLLAAIGASSLISKAIEKWADRNGYLDDPTKGLQWLISVLASIPDLPGFYPFICFLVGLVSGLWLDRFAKSWSNERGRELQSIGYSMLNLNEVIGRRSQRTLAAWPEFIADLTPEMNSVFIRSAKAGIWSPSAHILNLNDNGRLLINYLGFVGRLLADGHTDEAKVAALQTQADLRKSSGLNT